MRNVARLLPPEAGSLARGLAPAVVCGSLAGAAVAAQAALFARAIDAAFLGRRPLAALAPLLLSLAGVAALRAGLGFLQERLAQRLSGAVRVAVRDRLSRRLLALGPRFATGQRTGELASSLVGGVEALDGYLAQYLPQALLAGIVPALVLAAVWHADAVSGLVLLLTWPLVPLFMWLIGSAARVRTQLQWAALSRLAARFHEALAGLATLKAFGREADELAALERGNERHRALTLEVLRLAFLSALVLEALATLGTAVVAVEVGLRLLYDRITFREALFVLLLAPEFYRPLRALGAAFHAGMAGREAAARLLAIAEAGGAVAAPAVLEDAAASDRRLREQARPEAEPAAATAAPSARAGSAPGSQQHRDLVGPPRIRFESVAFAYGPGSRRALDGFTLEIGAGETVALVGASGAGKTTAAHLLLRFAEPDAGGILVDDAALAAQTPEAWRARVAWVPQQPRLFHGTLRANLVLGRPDAADGEIRRALELSCLEELVGELPAGLETPVGEGGERLSGGEAQRVALARAFLRDAPVLVLDEPTAQLDLATEAAVVDAVARLRRGRTVLLVAHRMTTLTSVERVAVVAEGRVLEQGPPAWLASSGVHYPRLVAAWRGAP